MSGGWLRKVHPGWWVYGAGGVLFAAFAWMKTGLFYNAVGTLGGFALIAAAIIGFKEVDLD